MSKVQVGGWSFEFPNSLSVFDIARFIGHQPLAKGFTIKTQANPIGAGYSAEGRGPSADGLNSENVAFFEPESADKLAVFFLLTHPRNTVGIFSPSYGHVMVTMARFEAVLKDQGLSYKVSQINMEISVPNHGRFLFRSMQNPSSLVGFETAAAFAHGLMTMDRPLSDQVLRQIQGKNRQRISTKCSMNFVGIVGGDAWMDLAKPEIEPLECPEAKLIRLWTARVGCDLKVLRAVGDVLIDQLSTSKKVSPAWVNQRPWVRKRKGGAA